MRFYLSARFKRQEEMREVRDALVDLGHKVTSRWIDADYGNNSDLLRSRQDVREQAAVENTEDIADADVVLVFTGSGRRGGANVEYGIAIGINKLCIIIGEPENTFHWLPSVDRYATIEDYLETLEESG